MHRRADDSLDGFEVQVAGFAAILKDRAQQSIYFAGNLLPDRFSRFCS